MNFNNKLHSEKFVWIVLWTGVRLPSSPPMISLSHKTKKQEMKEVKAVRYLLLLITMPNLKNKVTILKILWCKMWKEWKNLEWHYLTIMNFLCQTEKKKWNTKKFISTKDMTLIRRYARINENIGEQLEYDNFVSTSANPRLFT